MFCPSDNSILLAQSLDGKSFEVKLMIFDYDYMYVLCAIQ